jgi:flagellar biosynthesis protein FlhG
MYWGNKKVIAVGGEKNGIGKSTFVANIGIAMAKAGKRVIVVDADTGTTNLHTILGVTSPAKTLDDFLLDPKADLKNNLIATSYPGLTLLSSASNKISLFNPNYSERQRLFHALKELDVDVIIFDILAGTQQRATDFFSLAPIGIILVEPSQVSLDKAFTFLKNLLVRGLIRRFFHEKELTDLIHASVDKNIPEESIDFSKLLKQLEEKAPGKIIAYRQLFLEGVCTMCLVANGIKDSNQNQTIKMFASEVEKQLGLAMPVIGNLPFENDMKTVNENGVPFITKYPQSGFAKELEAIISQIMAIQSSETK